MYDIVIIGAGVTGCAVARELSRYNARICVLEKEEDVCCGTSKANSAIIHAGFDAKAGTLMAEMNVEGSKLMGRLSEELDFPFERNGSIVVCMNDEGIPDLEKLYLNGIKNGVENLRIVDKDELKELEPNISENAVAALYAPTGGIVCPFGLNIALAENANVNGVEFIFNTQVRKITKLLNSSWGIHTNNGYYETRYVINAAGVYADELHNMVSEEKIHITARRGDYCLLDKETEGFVRHTIFQLPSKLGKGVLVSPTIHGNTIVGPTAIDVPDKEGTNTTMGGLNELIEKAGTTVTNLPIRQVITSFSGLRAHEDHHEFIIGEAPDAPHFIDCAGIESPGLSSCPAIGVTVANMLKEKMRLTEKKHFNPIRKGILNPNKLTLEDRNKLIREKTAYGNIICRCEMITEGEIIDAIHRPLGAKSLDSIKRRTRAGMGRCQSGFCSPRTLEILSRELGINQSEITKCGGNSKLIVGHNKDTV